MRPWIYEEQVHKWFSHCELPPRVSPQDQEEQAFFAVFDGHGGVDAAIYAANHLHVNLVRHEFFKQDPIEALFRAFRITDERFIKKAAREVGLYMNIWPWSLLIQP